MPDASSVCRLLVHMRDRPEDLIASTGVGAWRRLRDEVMAHCREHGRDFVEVLTPIGWMPLVRCMPVIPDRSLADNMLQIEHRSALGWPRPDVLAIGDPLENAYA